MNPLINQDGSSQHLSSSAAIIDHAGVNVDTSVTTRDRIVSAVTDLIIEEHPAAISVPAVARRAGVSVATVYRYFPNKEQLLDAAAEIGARRTTSAFTGRSPGASFIEDLVATFFWELADHLPLARNQHYSTAGRALRKRRRSSKQRQLQDAAAQLDLEPDAPTTRRLLSMVDLLVSSSSLLELHDYQGVPIDEAAANVSWAVQVLAAATRVEQDQKQQQRQQQQPPLGTQEPKRTAVPRAKGRRR